MEEDFDWKDGSWWDKREMGSPDDPYNNIPKIKEDDELYKEYKTGLDDTLKQLLKESQTDEGWTFSSESDGIKGYYKDNPDDPVRCFKGIGIIRSTAEVIRLHLVQLDLRKYWDEMYLGGEFKFEVTDCIRVTYYKFSAPWPVSGRDILSIAGEDITDDGCVLSGIKSIKRDDCPEIEGSVRANCGPSGFVVKPIENDEDGTPRCLVTYVVQIDPSGWLPTWVVNIVNASQPFVIKKLGDVVKLTAGSFKDVMLNLFELDDWSAAKIKSGVTTAIAQNKAPAEMVWDPLRFLLTGKRIGDTKLAPEMEKIGKDECLKKIWEGIRPYMKSLPKSDPFHAKAAKFGFEY